MGRPRKIDDKRILHVVELETLRNGKISSEALVRIVREKTGIALSARSINTIRHILRFAFRPARRVPKLTSGQIRVRHQFAWDETRIREDGRSRIGSCQVVFSGESRFALDADRPWVWCRKGQYEAALSPLVHLVCGWPPNRPDFNPIETV
jgi:hypothetical protein